MSNASTRSVFAWRIAAVVSTSILLLSALGFCFVQLTQVQIDSVSFDESSEWNKYFLSKSGFSTIRICSHVAGRLYADHISIVGSNRPKAWFEQLGFEQVDDYKGFVHTITISLPDEGFPRRVVVMEHPMLPKKHFTYLPEDGILIYQYP